MKSELPAYFQQDHTNPRSYRQPERTQETDFEMIPAIIPQIQIERQQDLNKLSNSRLRQNLHHPRQLQCHQGKIFLFVVTMAVCITFAWLQYFFTRLGPKNINILLFVLAIIQSVCTFVYLLLNLIVWIANPSFKIPMKWLYLFDMDTHDDCIIVTDTQDHCCAAQVWFAILIIIFCPITVISLIVGLCKRRNVQMQEQ